MPGIYEEERASDLPRQPVAVLAAWIQELLGDVHAEHVDRLRVLRGRLQSDAFEWDNALLTQAISTVHSAGRELQSADLRPGLLARLFGRRRPAAARFLAAYERIVTCAARLKLEASELAASFKAHHAGGRRVLVELDIETNALQAEIDQAVTWLQDMCEQLAGAAQDLQAAQFAQAAQSFTHNLKSLQALAAVARDIGVRGQNLLERRSALLEQMRADLDGLDKVWMRAVGKAAAELKAQRRTASLQAGVAAAHAELMKRLEAASDACCALQQEEHLFGQKLGMLRKGLEAA